MLFLSEQEKREWVQYAREIIASETTPREYEDRIRTNLISAFHYFIGTTLAVQGQDKRCLEWLQAGALTEEEGLFSSTFLLGFLQRHKGKMMAPAVAFTDPRPFIHFAGVPIMKEARSRFVRQCSHTLPSFEKPVRFMDIGCGDGALTVMLLRHLQEMSNIKQISEILLVDSSLAMIDLAKKTVSNAFPGIHISTENARIQDCSAKIDHHYDIAMSSLAYHHMPVIKTVSGKSMKSASFIVSSVVCIEESGLATWTTYSTWPFLTAGVTNILNFTILFVGNDGVRVSNMLFPYSTYIRLSSEILAMP